MEEMRNVQKEIAEGLGLSVRYVTCHDISVFG
jgi:hypothetical protein